MIEFDSARIASLIRPIEGWPKPGVTFRDITPLLQSPEAMRWVTEALIALFEDKAITHIGMLEARGFIFGAQIAARFNLPLVPFRKPGKLPAATLREDYSLEYGEASLEVHQDALKRGDKILLVDDLIATGGTLLASATLCHRLGAEVVGAAAIIDLPFLEGSKKLADAGFCVRSLLQY